MASKSSKRRRKRRRRAAGGEQAAAAENGSAVGPARVRGKAGSSRPARRERDRGDQPPPAPWGSFPLIELTVLTGIVMLVLGFFFVSGDRGAILIGTGLLLGSIGGLELAIREHLAGYRSHTMVLAGVPAAILLGVLFYAGPSGLPPAARAAIAAGVFAIAALLLTKLFRERSGGESFRLSGLWRR